MKHKLNSALNIWGMSPTLSNIHHKTQGKNYMNLSIHGSQGVRRGVSYTFSSGLKGILHIQISIISLPLLTNKQYILPLF
jgi:hypothetical protein